MTLFNRQIPGKIYTHTQTAQTIYNRIKAQLTKNKHTHKISQRVQIALVFVIRSSEFKHQHRARIKNNNTRR